MRSLLIIGLILSLVSCQENADKKATGAAPVPPGTSPSLAMADSSQFTTIEWESLSKNYDKITEGQKLEVSFKFKNTGDKPLVIYEVRPSCGCTAAEPPKEPIAPGAEGVIKGSFDSNGKEGLQHKSLSVRANTKNSQEHSLQFQVNVEKKKS